MALGADDRDRILKNMKTLSNCLSRLISSFKQLLSINERKREEHRRKWAKNPATLGNAFSVLVGADIVFQPCRILATNNLRPGPPHSLDLLSFPSVQNGSSG